MQPILPAPIEDYVASLQRPQDQVLQAMERAGVERRFPIIGPVVGRFCEQQARAIGARKVFEMGSGFGYSTAWFARAVGPSGRVTHTEGSQHLSGEAQTWLGQAGVKDRVEFRVGDAVDLLRHEKGPFDVVFIDVDKEQYPEAWRVACERVRPYGLVLTDNTLWSGKVADPKAVDDATQGVRLYNERAFADKRFISTVVPLRDGVTVSLRLPE